MRQYLNKKPFRFVFLSFVVAGLLFTGAIGCRSSGDAPSDRLSVVTTIHPMEYFAQRVGGDVVDVTNLVSPGVEAHGYEPSVNDLMRLEQADLVVMNGMELEPWLQRALRGLGNRAPSVIIEAAEVSKVDTLPIHGEGQGEASEILEEIDRLVHEVEDGRLMAGEALERMEHLIHDLPSVERTDLIRQLDRVVHDWEDGRVSAEDAIESIDQLLDHGHGDHGEDHHDGHDHEHDHGEFDPHVWLDPLIAVVQVERIRDALIDLAPQHEELFRANADALINDLNGLHLRFQQTLSSCAHYHFVVTHSAYAYLAARYGLEQVPIAGLTPDAEPSAQRLAQIADQVRDLGLRYILVEPVLGARLADTLSRETGAELLPVHQIESVTLAELAEHGNYLGLMENNLRSLSLALECGS